MLNFNNTAFLSEFSSYCSCLYYISGMKIKVKKKHWKKLYNEGEGAKRRSRGEGVWGGGGSPLPR